MLTSDCSGGEDCLTPQSVRFARIMRLLIIDIFNNNNNNNNDNNNNNNYATGGIKKNKRTVVGKIKMSIFLNKENV